MRDYAEPCTSAAVELAYCAARRELLKHDAQNDLDNYRIFGDIYEDTVNAASSAATRLTLIHLRNLWDKIRDIFK